MALHACQSLRHTPVAPTAMTAPSGGHAGSGTCCSAGVPPYSPHTTARMVPPLVPCILPACLSIR